MARIVSVHSFRGGTGKSNTTANLGYDLVCVVGGIGMDEPRKVPDKGKNTKVAREAEILPTAPHETPPDRGGRREPTGVERKEIRKGGG